MVKVVWTQCGLVFHRYLQEQALTTPLSSPGHWAAPPSPNTVQLACSSSQYRFRTEGQRGQATRPKPYSPMARSEESWLSPGPSESRPRDANCQVTVPPSSQERGPHQGFLGCILVLRKEIQRSLLPPVPVFILSNPHHPPT